MPSQKSTITRAEIDANLDRVRRLTNEVDAMRKDLPLCPAWNAAGTVHQALMGLGQTLLDMKTGNGQVQVVS